MLRLLAWPNPQRGALWGLGLDLDAQADRVKLKVYTAALVLVARPELAVGLHAGWGQAAFPLPGLPPGLYYVTAQAEAQGQAGAWSRPAKVVRLP